MLLARRTGTGLVCHACTATPVHSRGECCLRDGLAQDLFVTQARLHRFIHVVNVACETDWHRTCLSCEHGHNRFIHVVNDACETDWHRTCLSCEHGHNRFIHVVNDACETDWHRTCLSRKHGHTGHSLAQDLFVTHARPHRSFTW